MDFIELLASLLTIIAGLIAIIKFKVSKYVTQIENKINRLESKNNELRQREALLRSKNLELREERDQYRVAFKTSLMMTGESIDLLDAAAADKKEFGKTIDILLGELSRVHAEKKVLLQTLLNVVDKTNQHNLLEREWEKTQAYELMITHLKNTNANLLQRVSHWIKRYLKLKNRFSDDL